MDDIQEKPTPAWRRRSRTALRWLKKAAPFALVFLASLLALGVYHKLTPPPVPLSTRQVEEIAGYTMASATPPPSVSSLVYQTILPSLVLIQTESEGDHGENGFGVGAGVIINNQAAILTALHVVQGAEKILVQFADGTESQAVIMVEAPEMDIAVLAPATPPQMFVPATIGSVNAIGDEVFAVGHPLGLAGSMSAGVVSGFDRTFKPSDGGPALEGLIQFDAAVNPGNSGGPLLNRAGQVVGIVTGLINPTRQNVFIGIGFAVPIGAAAGAAGGPRQ